ncbi:MAG: dihydropteroate synthase [Bacteroidales bacterium]|nr:dihydropteroate synthase [Bacteroidales bacterium]MCF8457819.1 dihydropteroate synthase [Bacteroidales bacterium]
MEHSGFKRKTSLQLNGELIDLSQPLVMGILNITPDSFYDGGRFVQHEKALQQVKQMLDEGAVFIDVGAVSSRPGAVLPDEVEELRRLIPVIRFVKESFPEARFSVDTFRSGVVQELFNCFGPFMVNDISAGEFDKSMFATVANLGLPYCMMHIQGKPQTMQENPIYNNLVQDILKYFALRVEKLKLLGVSDIIIDPGFGFGKSLDHNFELLQKLDHFKIFELPVMVGLSRKSMIYNLLGSNPDMALNGTSILHGLALERGANILRVHDVKEAMECIRLVQKVNGAG